MSQMMECFGKDKFNYIRKHTTRPPRVYEKDEYYFITPEEFAHKLLDYNSDEGFAEATSYAGHFYGTHESELIGDDVVNVGIFDLSGLDALMDGEYDIFILKVETPPDIRLLRMIKRDPHLVSKSAERFLRDEKEFINLKETVTIDYWYDNEKEGLDSAVVDDIWKALEKKWWS